MSPTGFVGNVALKISEGVASLVRYTLKESLKATITRQVGYMLSRSAFADFKKRLDHTEYGGAPLLGVKGVCFITHGSSNANAIKNAIRVAAEFAEHQINGEIERTLIGIRAARRHVGMEDVQQCNTTTLNNANSPLTTHRISFSRPGIAGGRHGQRAGREISGRPATPLQKRTKPWGTSSRSFASKGPRTSFA